MLYDILILLQPTSITRLHRTVALRYVHGAEAALAELECLAPTLDDHALFHATRAERLRAVDRGGEAIEADQRAAGMTTNPGQLAILRSRLAR